MARNKKNKPLFGGFDRLQSFPLDSSSVYDTWAELSEYCSSPIAYQGQLVVCLDKSNDEEHYGAYIMVNTAAPGNPNTYYLPYKLAGANEFVAQVDGLMNRVDLLQDKLNNVTEPDVNQLKTDVGEILNWLNRNAWDLNHNKESLLATKSEVEALASTLESIVHRIFNEQIDDINELIDQKDTIFAITEWIRTHEFIFTSEIQEHETRIHENYTHLLLHDDNLEQLAQGLTEAKSALDLLRDRIAQVEAFDTRITQTEANIEDITRRLATVEHIAEYHFTSLATISGVMYTPDMCIRSIEIVITETGEHVQDGLFDDTTSLTVEFASATNPAHVSEPVINSSEIIIMEDTKLVFDLEAVPHYNSYLRFTAENSRGMTGYAIVKYYTKPDVIAQPVQIQEPVSGGGN